nr:hypothetical protein [Tanacetum cinerariifolium]
MPPRRSNRVNNEADPAFTAAVAQAVADLLPTLTARITDEICQNENNGNNGNRRNSRRGNPGGSGNDEDAQPTDIHVWLERFQKEKHQTFSSASTPVEAENWIAHINKIFEVLGCDDQFKARLATYKLEEKEMCEREYKSIRQLPEETSTDFMKRFLRLAGFLGTKAGTQEEQAKHFKWGLNDFVLDRILNIEFTDVAQVANAARNIEIFHDRPKNEGDNKRDRGGHRIRPSKTQSQGSNPRADDRRDSDRYGNHGRHGNRDRYGTDRWCGDTQGNDKHGHQAREDTQIITHLPHVTFVEIFIQDRLVTGLLVLVLNVEKLGIWLKIVRKKFGFSSGEGIIIPCLILVLVFELVFALVFRYVWVFGLVRVSVNLRVRVFGFDLSSCLEINRKRSKS